MLLSINSPATETTAAATETAAATASHMLPDLGGPLTSGGAVNTVNTARLQRLLTRLARDEEAAYKRRAVGGTGGVGCRARVRACGRACVRAGVGGGPACVRLGISHLVGSSSVHLTSSVKHGTTQTSRSCLVHRPFGPHFNLVLTVF